MRFAFRAYLASFPACAIALGCASRGPASSGLSDGGGTGVSEAGHGNTGLADGGPGDASGQTADGQGGLGNSGVAVDGSSNGGGDGGLSGEGGTSADGASSVGPGTYALNPPKQCDNQFYVPNCTPGNAATACGGTCSAQSACESAKPNDPDIGFLCPRFILFGAEMTQAAKDDWGANPAFNYAIVGHDPDTVLDQNGTSGTRSCCQCYQLVFDEPNESEGDVNGQADAGSAVAVPPPLVVQAFNTSAGGGQNFDVFMGAGGFGGNNACDPNFTQQPSPSGEYLYTAFPEVGEGNNGGEKAAILKQCLTSENLVTSATLSSSSCQAEVQSDCDEIAATTAAVATETIQSCVASNDPSTFYHLNWKVYAKKVECPTHLTEVTGCKLASQGDPAANPNVTTATQAKADGTFLAGYTTTTMQDCCKPTCAWQDNVSSAGTAVGEYNSFYSCNQSGVPVTE
jgi:hypothetical protein